MNDDLRIKNERNRRVSARYDELMREGKHGHYETIFRVVREEVEAERERCAHIALAIDSKRGNEKEIARAIRNSNAPIAGQREKTWACWNCNQLNSEWATKCGRCGQPMKQSAVPAGQREGQT